MGNASRTQTKQATGLHVCPACGSGLVQPTCWEQTDERGSWRLWRRCPDCEWRGEGVHRGGAIDTYDEELDNGAEMLSGALRELEHENMRHMVENFAAALSADLITAEDFG
jgi:hypothetical protein